MIIAHFFAGPLHGKTHQLHDAPLRIYVPQAPEISLFGPPFKEVPISDFAYRLRGPVLAGHAYYDFEPWSSL